MSRGSNARMLFLVSVCLIAIGFGVFEWVSPVQVPLATTHDGVLTPSLELGTFSPLAGGTADEVPARPAEDSTAREPVPAGVDSQGDPSSNSPRVAKVTRKGQGRVRIRALDARTSEPLNRVRVRAASTTRIADRTADSSLGELELCLTPGTYSLLVLSRGYEPLELPPLNVEPGATLEPDPVRLFATSARVVGSVRGDHSPERGLRVELLGTGRGPCASCADPATLEQPSRSAHDRAWVRSEPCAQCGFAANASRLALRLDGVFAFDNLAAGAYALRLVDAHDQSIGVARHIRLRAADALVVELDAVELRSISVELVDADGTSLAEEWAKRLREQEPIEDERISWDEVAPLPVFACQFRAEDVCLARSTFVPPKPLDGLSHGATFTSRTSGAGSGPSVTGRTGVDDRPRAESETLNLKAFPPTIQPFTVSSSVDAAGLVHFEPLPALALTLEMSCGPFSATVAIPSSNESVPIRAQLVPSAESRTQVESGATHKTFSSYESGRDP